MFAKVTYVLNGEGYRTEHRNNVPAIGALVLIEHPLDGSESWFRVLSHRWPNDTSVEMDVEAV